MLDSRAPWVLDRTVFDGARRRDWLRKLISEGSPEIWDHVAHSGLTASHSSSSVQLWATAELAIDSVPELSAIVRARVRHIHVITAPRDYDISHSEPFWEDRIFVSVPERCDGVGAVRLAENIIHEAMHLHLTAFEDVTPLVKDPPFETYSPWRESNRPLTGVLHGLFVFACLREYFCRLSANSDPIVALHVEQRIRDIYAQLAQVDFEFLLSGLTGAGRALVGRILPKRLVPVALGGELVEKKIGGRRDDQLSVAGLTLGIDEGDASLEG